ncbi:type II secretion system minor pseudopilin GspH [Pseudomonas sp. CrR14]|nr:type II secretion system minor pseudopilin GspH [Pseudomonas sp. CrR14]
MRQARGFTLIELLVVLVIIGTMVSLAVLSIGSSGSRELRNEAERLAALIGVLADEAVLDGQEYGLRVTAEGYQVLSYDNLSGTWSDSDSQKEHRTPASLRLTLELDGEALKLPEPEQQADQPGLASNSEEKKEPLVPQLLILSSGELSPFRLRLEERRAGGNAYALASDGYQLPSADMDDRP